MGTVSPLTFSPPSSTVLPMGGGSSSNLSGLSVDAPSSPPRERSPSSSASSSAAVPPAAIAAAAEEEQPDGHGALIRAKSVKNISDFYIIVESDHRRRMAAARREEREQRRARAAADDITASGSGSGSADPAGSAGLKLDPAAEDVSSPEDSEEKEDSDEHHDDDSSEDDDSSILGRGSYGLVKKVYNTQDNQFYAMKIIDKTMLSRGRAFGRQKSEGDAFETVRREIAIMKKRPFHTRARNACRGIATHAK